MNALTLKCIALASMLLDHIGYCLGVYALRCVGRLAFPIYVFLLVNGLRHTKSRPRYALRLGLFALISQLPFTLFERFTKLPWQGPETLLQAVRLSKHGSVFVTLFFAFVCLWAVDACKDKRILRWLSFLPAAAVCALYLLGVISSDYGVKGVLLAFAFYYLDGRPVLLLFGSIGALFFPQLLRWASELLALLTGTGPGFTAPSAWTATQLFALLPLPLIRLYNGERGPMPENRIAEKSLQLGFYLFYPVHLTVLYLIFS